MAADVTIVEKNGAPGTPTDKTSGTVRFKNADDATVDSNNPMVIPTSGADFSYEKWLRLKIGNTAPSDKINNLKFYTDGVSGFGTGISLWAKTVAAYSTPATTTTSTNYTDAFSYTVGGALALSSTDFSATNTEIGSHLVMLMEVSSTATAGALSAETGTFSYDEI
jgi:hypothetical protein